MYLVRPTENSYYLLRGNDTATRYDTVLVPVVQVLFVIYEENNWCIPVGCSLLFSVMWHGIYWYLLVVTYNYSSTTLSNLFLLVRRSCARGNEESQLHRTFHKMTNRRGPGPVVTRRLPAAFSLNR